MMPTERIQATITHLKNRCEEKPIIRRSKECDLENGDQGCDVKHFEFTSKVEGEKKVA
jgi:hypothetical protein